MITLGFDFLLTLNNMSVGDYLAPSAETDYIKVPFLPISE
jgi:hypothetical protein